MRILVVGGFESSSRRAHAINTAKMAQGFARCGHAVTLVCRRPATGTISPTLLNRDFGITAALRWVQLPNRLGQGWRFASAVLGVALAGRAELVYARSFAVPRLTTRLGILSVAESHAHVGDRSPGLLGLCRTSQHEAFGLWVTISDVLQDYYRSLGAAAHKLVTLPDAVDLEAFARPHRLPPNPYVGSRPRVVYCGHLYDYKGIPTIIEAAEGLAHLDFHLVGGLPEDVQRTRQRLAARGLTNVTLHGHRPPADVPPYLWHADVLLLPPSAHHPSARWTSPVKLGEYLASGVPVVSTSIPALRDWLTDAETRFVEPDDPLALADGIQAVLADRALAASLSEAGRQKAPTLAYRRRAERVLSHPEVAHRLARGWLRNAVAGLMPRGGSGHG